ncbi:MAG: biopolymer transporter ExbD [Gammaproteobacteria bacterium]|nr:biopolymer transporter ExbD [Gammaproteobacteria bacterium]
MKFARPRRSGRGFAVVEITPLIDVIFLLLIFFVVSTTFVRTSAIEVDLPDASGAVDGMPAGIEVRVTATGDYAVNGQALPVTERAELVRALGRARDQSGDPTPLLVIAADAESRHANVVRVMDVARELGLTKLTVLTEARSPTPDDEADDG